MKHTQECLEAQRKSYEYFERRVQKTFEEMRARGIDTSMRGFGHAWECICGADKVGTQTESVAAFRENPKATIDRFEAGIKVLLADRATGVFQYTIGEPTQETQ